MITKLLLGALVAAVGPQDPEVPRQARNLEIEIPAIDLMIPGLDIQIPKVDVRVPGFDFDLPAHEFEVAGIEIPDLALALPALRVAIPDWGHGVEWRDEEFSSHPQDAELDTVFEVNPSARLEVRNHAGEIVVATWDRNAVRIEASHSSHDRVKIFAAETSVKVKSETRHGLPDMVDYRITVPATMPVDLWGFYTDIQVAGVKSGVRVETLNGDIQIRDCAGEISLRSVEGDVTLQGSSGRLEVNNVENDITVTGFEGELVIESIDGDIRLEDVRSVQVEAKTVDGDLFYNGSIADDGRYRLTTHEGDVLVAVPENINVTVSVATFDGNFEADFPVQLGTTEAGRRFSFTIGSGAARLELHSFDGDIRLQRR